MANITITSDTQDGPQARFVFNFLDSFTECDLHIDGSGKFNIRGEGEKIGRLADYSNLQRVVARGLDARWTITRDFVTPSEFLATLNSSAIRNEEKWWGVGSPLPSVVSRYVLYPAMPAWKWLALCAVLAYVLGCTIAWIATGHLQYWPR